jgi:FkbM family methyltransferase
VAQRARFGGLPPLLSGFATLLVQGRARLEPGTYASSIAPFDLYFDRFDMAERFFALRGIFEWRIAAVAAAVLRPGDVVFEGGAQLGTETFNYCTRVGSTGRVVSFEADPQLAARLNREVARLGMTQCTVWDKALGERPGVAQFELAATPSSNSGLGSLAPDDTATDGRVTVQVATLDEAYDAHGAPRLVVMDIQGGELAALRGGARTLAEARPVVVLEVESDSLRRLGGSAEELLALLRDAGYDCWRFTRLGLRPVDAPRGGELGDWLAVPREAAPELLPRLRRTLLLGGITPPRSRYSPLSYR